MFRQIGRRMRAVFFSAAILIAFFAGGLVFNLDRLGDLDIQILKYKQFLPRKVRKLLPSENLPYATPQPKMTITGRVLEVYDGDTVTILDGSRKFRVRFYGIDAPEAAQEYGIESRDLLRELILGKTVAVSVMNVDNYGRAVARITSGETDINAKMVREGAAWHYRQFAPHETAYAEAETAARTAKKGLWSAASPVPPWDYRKQTKAAKQ